MPESDEVMFEEIVVISLCFNTTYTQIASAWDRGDTREIIGYLVNDWRGHHRYPPSPLMTWGQVIIKYHVSQYYWDTDKKYLIVKGNFPKCFALYKATKEGDHFKC